MHKTTVEVSNLIYLPMQNPTKERNSKGFQEMIWSKKLCTKAQSLNSKEFQGIPRDSKE